MRYTKIKTLDQYNEYCEKHEKLTYSDYDGNIEEIGLIQILIDEYESRTIEKPEGMEPVVLIQYLIEEIGISKTELANQLGVSRQLITDILNYRRNISKVMINKLSERFCLNPSAFSKQYKLKSASPKKQRQTA